MTNDLVIALVIRPWREYDYKSAGVSPPFANWEEHYVWPCASKPGCTFSYYKVSQGSYGVEEWIILWDETKGNGKPEFVWRVM